MLALCFIEPEFLPIEVVHCVDRDFRPFCSRDFGLDPMTFIYELEPYSLEMHRMSENELLSSRLSKVILSQTQTYIYNGADIYTTRLIRTKYISNRTPISPIK